MEAPAPALNTVRGFHGTPVTSGDEDSDQGVTIKRGAGAGVAMERGGSESSVTRRGRKPMPILDDVVSANCSPVLRPAGSPAVGGIAKLRMQMDPFTLDTSAASSRASSPGAKTKAAATTATSNASATARVASPLSTHKARGKGNKENKGPAGPTGQSQSQLDNLFRGYEKRPDSSTSTKATESDASRVATAVSSRSTSHDGISSNTSSDEAGPDTVTSDDMTSYVIRLKSDFISESVRGGGAGLLAGDDSLDNEMKSAIFEADLDVDDVASTYKAMTALGSEATPGVDGNAANDTHTDKDKDTDTAAKKITSDDFEPLRCLGKGSYGTVLLVKQKATGRLYAQKQFKKASLVVHKKLVQQTKTERQILESVNRHPFVVKLFYAFQDHEKLYLILEYGQGGELFTHLSSERMFSEETSAFYMAEMVLALSHLHDTLGVVYRDLKPENCLLDAEGHLLLTDFGLSKVALPGPRSRAASDATTSTTSTTTEVSDDACCHSILGTVEYMAPEVVQGQVYGRAVDWWSFGALGFDLMTGNPPFRGRNNAKIQENIVKQKLQLPYFLSPDAKDLLTRLLRKDPRKRLGATMPKDLGLMKGHRFFRKINWARLAAREVEPPIQPVITDPELAENFASEFTDLPLSPVSSPTLQTREPFVARPRGPSTAGARDDPFGGFSFVASTSLLNESNFPVFME